MVDVITCALFGDCRLRGVNLVRRVSLPFPIDLRLCELCELCALTTLVTLLCDRVISSSRGLPSTYCVRSRRAMFAIAKFLLESSRRSDVKD